ncbi:hypothetical protein [Microbacterium sp. MMO-10]|uniref:hypothetical protein n=1 Tax=Microbacterium sp. MMO-10 TaxID=3081272 RepID=UPI00301896BA
MSIASTHLRDRVRDIAPLRMRIILGFVLVLLMLVGGVWSVLHAEPGDRFASVSNTPAATIQVETAATGDDGMTPAIAVGTGALPADGSVLGVAGCALGALCCLLIVAVARRLLRRATATTVCLAGRVQIPLVPSARSHAPSPSIVALSVLRT